MPDQPGNPADVGLLMASIDLEAVVTDPWTPAFLNLPVLGLTDDGHPLIYLNGRMRDLTSLGWPWSLFTVTEPAHPDHLTADPQAVMAHLTDDKETTP